MKKFRLGFIALVCALTGSIAFISCENETDTTSTPSAVEYQAKETLEIFDQPITITTVDGQEIVGAMKLTVEEESGKLVSVEFSKNILGAGLDIDDNPISFADQVTTMADGEGQISHSECIQNCWDTYVIDGKKQKRFGACRFNCWVDTTVRVLEAAAKILSATAA